MLHRDHVFIQTIYLEDIDLFAVLGDLVYAFDNMDKNKHSAMLALGFNRSMFGYKQTTFIL